MVATIAVNMLGAVLDEGEKKNKEYELKRAVDLGVGTGKMM